MTPSKSLPPGVTTSLRTTLFLPILESGINSLCTVVCNVHLACCMVCSSSLPYGSVQPWVCPWGVSIHLSVGLQVMSSLGLLRLVLLQTF